MSVEIYDNFLNKDEFKKLLAEINKREYSWGHGSGDADKFPWLHMDLNNCEYAHHILKNKIEPIVNMSFDVERIYMNGQMYGCQSSFHIDSSEDNARTFLYFIHDYTPKNADIYGGYFYYKLNMDKAKQRSKTYEMHLDKRQSSLNTDELIRTNSLFSQSNTGAALMIEPQHLVVTEHVDIDFDEASDKWLVQE